MKTLIFSAFALVVAVTAATIINQTFNAAASAFEAGMQGRAE